MSLYNEITVKWIDSIEGEKIASFFSPKTESEQEGEPFIAIFNADSNTIFQVCDAYDHVTTECIMKLIREKFIIPKGDESIFYIIFVLLHEAGHWYDYHNRRSWYNQNVINEVSNSAEEYRQRPIEKSADRFAIEHFEEAWNELTACFPSGLMEPLKKN